MNTTQLITLGISLAVIVGVGILNHFGLLDATYSALAIGLVGGGNGGAIAQAKLAASKPAAPPA